MPRDLPSADLVIACEGAQFKVHRSIVCPKSAILAAAAKQQFKEGATGVFTVNGFDKHTVSRFIDYLYTADYDTAFTAEETTEKANEALADDLIDLRSEIGELSLNDGSENLLIHARLSAMADFYDVPNLRDVAIDRFLTVLKDDWNADWFIRFLAETDFNCMDKQLLAIARDWTVEHIHELLYRDDFRAIELPHWFYVDVFRAAFGKENEAETQNKRFRNGLKRAARILQSTGRCPKCRDWGLNLEIDEDEKTGEVAFAVRCSRCRREF
ncbi:hypothetical protein KEM55_003147 [Ascosphaera atra]|nr:hypothetical protein KEM55_003147 [Ascosphaera atra]